MNYETINIEQLKSQLAENLSYNKIADLLGCSRSKIKYCADKNNLKASEKYRKVEYTNINYFNVIDTELKAYLLGFLLGDSHISVDDKKLELSVAYQDRDVLNIFENVLGCRICDDMKYNKAQRKFPNSSISIGNMNIIRDVKKLFGGRLKPERHIPNIKKAFDVYLLAGFFDAEGCITFGNRKDRNRKWQKISFTSQYNMLIGIQKILYKNGFVTSIKPKSSENCYVLEFSSSENVNRFAELILNTTNIVGGLNRKRKKIREYVTFAS